jgi:lipopolysaccharide/colanic/teichoic acid biosynthesis glycosyltransferase
VTVCILDTSSPNRSRDEGRATADAGAAPRVRTRMADRRAVLAGIALVAGDVAVLVLAAVVAGGASGEGPLLGGNAVALAAWPALLWVTGFYDRRPWGVERTEGGELAMLVGAALAAGAALFTARHLSGAGGGVGALVVAFATAVALGAAAAMRAALRPALNAVLGPERVLIVGDDPVLDRVLSRLRPGEDVELVDRTPSGDLRQREIADGHARVDHLVAAALPPETLDRVLTACRGRVPRVSLVGERNGRLGAVTGIEGLQGVAFLRLRHDGLSRASTAGKRAIDVLGAAAALMVLAPLLLVISVAIPLGSRGPVVFRQPRVGRGGRPFVMWKFRTMVADAERRREALLSDSRDPRWLHLERDPRITRLGRWLRQSSLDELPQLWNVLRGDMSLVGPRPLVPKEYEHVPAWGRGDPEVRPGITGLWQVCGRTDIPFDDMLVLDRVYALSWSLRGDLLILLRTAPAVLSSRGAN